MAFASMQRPKRRIHDRALPILNPAGVTWKCIHAIHNQEYKPGFTRKLTLDLTLALFSS